jgi:hypothetical protein
MGKARSLTVPSIDDLYAQYPHLQASEHKITSQRTDRYNCVAWVDRDMTHWLEPEIFWPDEVPEPEGQADLDCYLALFRSWGFEPCESPEPEDGFLRIAIFATGMEFDHVAKQLPSGAWSSKGGPLYDFKHQDLDALRDSPVMPNAAVVQIMRRPHDGVDPYEMEENGLIRT